MTTRAFQLVLCVALLSLPTAPGIAQVTTSGFPHVGNVPCNRCHVCEAPTTANPCLLPCPRLSAIDSSAAHTLSEAPDTVVLDVLKDLYQGVRFNHRLHANMAQMGGNCATCHHYSPEGQIPPCRQCHGGERNAGNLEQPSLKGAYHRQCLNCHREWSHETQCVVCHLPLPGKTLAGDELDSTDIIGLQHPRITEPDKRVYYTPHPAGPIVTFYHSEHVELFGLRCVDCHQEENCSRCHDMQQPTRFAKTDVEIHSTCNGCHEDDRCDKCHGMREVPAFTHAVTGWPLNRFHRTLDCRACHPTGRRIGRLNSSCDGCHGGWGSGNFDHAVTGLVLDEEHRAFDCGDCHTGRRFGVPPSCSECHDDERSADVTPPGTRLAWPSD